MTYSNQAVFLTYPFPDGLTPNIAPEQCSRDQRAVDITAAAVRLYELRSAWIRPLGLVRTEPEVAPGYPDRIVPVDAVAATKLQERTLTNLYTEEPQWLVDAHRELDAVVAAAYGWLPDISEDEALAGLLELNLARAAAPAIDAPVESHDNADVSEGDE